MLLGLGVTTTAHAMDMSGLEGASIAYVSKEIGATTGFYGVAGEKIITGVLSNGMTVDCGLFDDATGAMLYHHYDDTFASYTLPYSGVFAYDCIYVNGYEDYILAFAMEYNAFYRSWLGTKAVGRVKEVSPLLGDVPNLNTDSATEEALQAAYNARRSKFNQ